MSMSRLWRDPGKLLPQQKPPGDVGRLHTLGEDRCRSGAAGRQPFREVLTVELHSRHERRHLDRRGRGGSSGDLRLTRQDRLKDGLDLAGQDDARLKLERDLDGLPRCDVAGVVPADLDTHDGLRRVDKNPAAYSGALLSWMQTRKAGAGWCRAGWNTGSGKP